MPTREAARRSAELREQAKTDPALAAVLRKKRKAAKKAAATRIANAATKADVALAQVAADLAPGQPTPPPPADTMSLQAQQDRAAAARAALATKRAAGLVKHAKRRVADPNEHTLPGRIDLALQRMGKTLIEMAHGTGISASGFHALRRGDKATLRQPTFDKVAAYLGVTVEWLQNGGDAPAVPAQLIPHAATVLKANGKAHHASHEARVEQAMQTNIDTTITTLWSLLPMDAKVMVIARVAELVAMGRK